MNSVGRIHGPIGPAVVRGPGGRACYRPASSLFYAPGVDVAGSATQNSDPEPGSPSTHTSPP